MKLVGAISTAVLSLSLGIGIPAYAQQEQHDQQEENKDKPAQEKEKEKKAQPEHNAKPEEKNARQEDKNTKPENRNAQEQHAQQSKPEQREEHAGGGRIPADRYKANFGREHSFRVSEGDYRNHRFQYGGYWFGFASVVAEQLAVHAGRLCCRDQRRVLPVQCELSGREPGAQRDAVATSTVNEIGAGQGPALFPSQGKRSEHAWNHTDRES